MEHPRIETPCPTCGNRTLFVGSGGHLVCSWLKCEQPGVEHAIELLKRMAEKASPPVFYTTPRLDPDYVYAKWIRDDGQWGVVGFLDPRRLVIWLRENAAMLPAAIRLA